MEKIEKSNFFRSMTFKIILKTVSIVIIVLIIFQIGVFVGYRKAKFSYGFGDNYSRMFGEPRRGFSGVMGESFTNGHGVTGKIIKISLPTIIIEATDNIEKVILVDSDASIRKFREVLTPADLKVNDFVVVIGTPDNNGQIDARLVRLIPPSPTNVNASTTINK